MISLKVLLPGFILDCVIKLLKEKDPFGYASTQIGFVDQVAKRHVVNVKDHWVNVARFSAPPQVFRGQEVGNGPPHNEPRERGDFAWCLDPLLLILSTLYVWTAQFAIKNPRLYDEFPTEITDLLNKCTKIDKSKTTMPHP